MRLSKEKLHRQVVLWDSLGLKRSELVREIGSQQQKEAFQSLGTDEMSLGEGVDRGKQNMRPKP